MAMSIIFVPQVMTEYGASVPRRHVRSEMTQEMLTESPLHGLRNSNPEFVTKGF